MEGLGRRGKRDKSGGGRVSKRWMGLCVVGLVEEGRVRKKWMYVCVYVWES